MTVASLGGHGGSKLITRLQQPQARGLDTVLADPRVSLARSGRSRMWHTGINAGLPRPGKAASQARLMSLESGIMKRLNDRTTLRSVSDVVRNRPLASMGGAYLRASLGGAPSRRRDALVSAILSQLRFVEN